MTHRWREPDSNLRSRDAIDVSKTVSCRLFLIFRNGKVSAIQTSRPAGTPAPSAVPKNPVSSPGEPMRTDCRGVPVSSLSVRIALVAMLAPPPLPPARRASAARSTLRERGFRRALAVHILQGEKMRMREDTVDLSELELQGLVPRSRWTRRGFVATSLVTGFALSVQPISAETITTDSTGLVAGEVKVKTADVQIPAYRAMPDKSGPFPTVLVVQKVFGVHEHIKDLCRRLAKAGYFAIAPELYVRQGDPSKYTEIPKLVAELVSKVPDEQVNSDLDAAVAYAKGSGEADTAKLAVTGFCWGGRITWLYAAHNPGLKAAVAWYGSIDRPRTELQPKFPIDIAAELMAAACKAAGKTCEIKIYPDTPHGFNADYRPSYRPEAAKDGWAKMLTWFKEHGVA